MRKLIGRVVVLALILAALIVLHDRWGGKEAPPDENAEPQDAAATEAVDLAAQAPSREIAMGTIRENGERGGVDITVTEADGSLTTYTFTDVAKDSWYADAVSFAVANGLMNGAGDGTVFQPEYGVLRESFAVILQRFVGGPADAPEKKLSDVPEDAWYRDAVYWAAGRRLMPATAASTFGVGEYLTCEDALRILFRLAGEPETEATLADYPYAPKVSDSARSAVAWAWEKGLITEIECVWYPTQTVSRAQVALLLMRYRMLIG